MTTRESSAAETLDDGHQRGEPGAGRRRIITAVLIGLASLVAVAIAVRSLQSDDLEPGAVPEPSEPAVVAVRAEVVDSGSDTLVTLRFDNLPQERTILDIAGLPDQVSYIGPRIVTIPDDGDIDVTFRWAGIDCDATPPGYVALELRLGRPGADLATSTVLVDAAGAFDYAWQEACNKSGP